MITIDQVYRDLLGEIYKLRFERKNTRLEPQTIERDKRLSKLDKRIDMKEHLKKIIEDHLL